MKINLISRFKYQMDIENVSAILDNEFLTPVALFHSHQAIEKSIKCRGSRQRVEPQSDAYSAVY